MDTIKDKYSFDERSKLSTKLLHRYVDMKPVIVEPGNNKQPFIERTKFLVPTFLTIHMFLLDIRKYIELDSYQTIYTFTETNTILVMNEIIGDVYNKYKDEDGFLYLNYMLENTFG